MSLTFTVRATPARLAANLTKVYARPTSSTTATFNRAFHNAGKQQKSSPFLTPLIRLAPKSSTTNGTSIVARLAQAGSRRGYQTQQFPPVQSNDTTTRKLVVGGAIFGVTLIAINALFNRETREDGGMPQYEREYLNGTFLHTGIGIGIIGLTAQRMVKSGFVYRLMVTNPWVVSIGGIALSIGSMMLTRSIDPDNYIPKYAAWTAFNVTQAAFIAPLLAFGPPALVARAGLYTIALMGSISFVGATAKQDQYLYLGAPLLAGAALVLASAFAPMVLPVTAVRTLAFTENVYLYGGLAVFGGFTLYDVQKILYHARMAEQGAFRRDTVNESISLEMDFLNIFIRLFQILMMQQNRKR